MIYNIKGTIEMDNNFIKGNCESCRFYYESIEGEYECPFGGYPYGKGFQWNPENCPISIDNENGILTIIDNY